MADWNTIFSNKGNIPVIPQIEVYKYIKKLESIFPGTKLNIWDNCCGGGRNSLLVGKMGHNIYASDNAPNGVSNTKYLFDQEHIQGTVLLSDMTNCPFSNIKFHGIICWAAMHHNNYENIKKTSDCMYNALLENGRLLVSLMSTKSNGYKSGNEIERNTFVFNEGDDAGVPHHYFDMIDIKDVFGKYKHEIIAEEVVNYIETSEIDYYISNPFPNTKWLILLKK